MIIDGEKMKDLRGVERSDDMMKVFEKV